MDTTCTGAAGGRPRPVARLGSIVVLSVIAAGTAVSETIDWVDFSAYPAGAASQDDLAAADGLVVTASFSTLVNIRPGWPVGAASTVDDPTWPFVNDQISGLGLISAFGTTLVTTLRFDFTSPGGLPAGGSVGIFDLEDPSSSIQLTGFVDGQAIEPVWAVSLYQTLGVQAPPPAWSPSTAILSGTIPIGMAPGDVNNFAFLATDRQLDALELRIELVDSDGVRIAIAGVSVPAPDADSDGLGDNIDNCVLAANPSQTDADLDGLGNACDADINNDCLVNFGDLALLKAVFFPNPYDGNADFNDDGFVNFGDLALMKSAFFNGASPGPGPSGLPNICDGE